MGLLDGGAAAIFAQAFSGFYLDATLHTVGEIAYTNGIITGNGEADIAVKAQLDAASYAMQQSAGYVDGDMRILILNPGQAVTTDYEITIGGTRWKIMSVAQDPALAYYDCRGRRG